LSDNLTWVKVSDNLDISAIQASPTGGYARHW